MVYNLFQTLTSRLVPLGRSEVYFIQVLEAIVLFNSVLVVREDSLDSEIRLINYCLSFWLILILITEAIYSHLSHRFTPSIADLEH